MKERPILYSSPMVKAVLADLKDITRRALSPRYIINKEPDRYKFHGLDDNGAALFEDLRPEITPWISPIPCPYGQPGDILWVRETFHVDMDGVVTYKADHPYIEGIWKPSIFMPRHACRLKLEIVSIRVERLHDITEEDAIREGLSKISKDGGITWKYGIPDKDGLPGTDDTGWPWVEWEIRAREAFKKLWIAINGQESWDSNPWVWRIEFKKLNTVEYDEPVKKCKCGITLHGKKEKDVGQCLPCFAKDQFGEEE